MRRVLQGAHTAVGFRDGMTHTEVRLTEDGPKIVEINARIGGDLIPYLGLLTTGIDPGLAAADIACGRAPRLTPTRARVGAVRFFYPEREMVVGEVRVADAALPGEIDRVVALGQPGDTLAPPPKGHLFGRFAYATAVGDDEDACLRALDAAAGVLSCHAADDVAGVDAASEEMEGARA
jgi:biotin carboxylase